jgi:hypothetical protein
MYHTLVAMSALGQKQTCTMQNAMSALPPKADMCSATRNARYVPIAAILMFNSITSSPSDSPFHPVWPCGAAGNARRLIRAAGVFRTVWSVATLSAQKAEEGLLACSSDINASVLDDTVVQKNCSRSASTAPQRQARSGRRFHRICHRHLSSSNFHQLAQE